MNPTPSDVHLAPHAVDLTKRHGAWYLKSRHALDPVAGNTGVWLDHWADAAPDRVFLAERDGDDWRTVSYRDAQAQVRAIASWLLDQGLDGTRPVAILSGNSVNHALLSYACQYVGIPTVPFAEQYALIPDAVGRLLYQVDKITPALLYVEDETVFERAINLPELASIAALATRPAAGSARCIAFSELLSAGDSPLVDAAHAKVTPDTVAKILFTSGSTSSPKGVITTQHMMCANQSQIASALRFLRDKPPVLLDWLPWNHVFGGSHNINMMLANGGSFYIDNGKPTAALFERTIENIKSVSGSITFNVPMGYALLVAAMRQDEALRQAFFANLDMLFYSGASLPLDIWHALEDMAVEVRGTKPLMTTSWGMTETAPAVLLLHEHIDRSGIVGVPLPGTEVKLIPDADLRFELRVKGPNITPGYYEDAEKTAELFDDEGFMLTGDAMRLVNPDDPDRGLMFDGRIGEDFKLATGTWVQASRLRLDILDALKGCVRDVVLCGHDRNVLGLFVFPPEARLASLSIDDELVSDSAYLEEIRERLAAFSAQQSGSARRVARAIVLAEPPSLKDGEITDKGSLNVRMILAARSGLVDRLYADTDDPCRIAVTG